MTKATRRLVALVLCLAMMLSMSVMASAASVSWNDGYGSHTITVTSSGATAAQSVAFTTASKVTYNGTTNVQAPYSAA